MALIKCPECGKKISDKAKSCANCGYPINKALENLEETVQMESSQNDEALNKLNHTTKSKKKKLTVIIISAIAILGVFIWVFAGNYMSQDRKIIIECGSYIKESLIDQNSMIILEDPKMYVFDDENYEHPFTYVVFSYSANSALGITLTDHSFFYVEQDKSQWKYIGDDNDFNSGIDATSKEMGQLSFMVTEDGWDSAKSCTTFSAKDIATKVGCEYEQ